jgi:CheY-like chemotaxis protein
MPPRLPTSAPSKSAANLHGRHQVLVVDDFDPTRDAIVAMLETKGFDVKAAASGVAALDLLQAGFRPCAMLLDVRMPDLDGWEVWDRMKRHPELVMTPVVILSADAADHVRARAAGIREFVRKPVDGARLTGILDRHCERRRGVYE